MTHLPMPDYIDSLEDRLRSTTGRTGLPSPAGSRARRGRPLALSLIGIAALGLALLFGIPGGKRATTPAYGSPPLLRQAPVAAPAILERLNAGLSVRMALGDGAKLTEVRTISAFGSRGYAVTGPLGWCLLAPDPTLSSDALKDGGMTCARIREVNRYGIALAIGTNLLVALPSNAKPPTLETPDGSATALAVSEDGLVAVEDVARGSIVVLYGEDGSSRRVRAG